MKYVISTFLLFALVLPCAAQNVERYLFAGVSTYDEVEEFSSVKKGIGLKGGGGLKFNERFGMEFMLDNAPALDPPRAAEIFAEELEVINSYYGRFDARIRIITSRNFYSSVVGTYTVPLTDRRSWIFKSGVSYVRFKTKFKPGFEEFISYKEEDFGIYLSGGISLQWSENRSAEFSINHITGDAKATSAQVMLKHHF